MFYLLHHFPSHCARRSGINYSKSPWNNYLKQGSLLSRKRVVSWIPERWVLLIAWHNDKDLSAFPALRIQAEVPFHLGIVCPYFSRVAVKPEYSLFCTQKSLVNVTFFFDKAACHLVNFFWLSVSRVYVDLQRVFLKIRSSFCFLEEKSKNASLSLVLNRLYWGDEPGFIRCSLAVLPYYMIY